MPDRKNIFLIGRRGHERDEDQLTEMLAFLWQERPEILSEWLASLRLPLAVEQFEVETQFTIPSGKRPDILIRSNDSTTLVESKLGSRFGETQVLDYLEFLGAEVGSRALILLTQRPEIVPAEYARVAKNSGIALIPTRWQEMAERLGDPGEETLAGDSSSC